MFFKLFAWGEMRNILAVEMGRNIEWFLKYITHFFLILWSVQTSICFIIFFSFKNNDRETNQQRSKNTTGPLFGDFGTFFLALKADHTHSADIEVPRNLLALNLIEHLLIISGIIIIITKPWNFGRVEKKEVAKLVDRKYSAYYF